ncbi:MAG: ABC transporter ATP-binding protein [Deltaproteobacteria bacterium]|nr:ABC transporter ATP-binding protein [Deltaproteobacteria bacterium]
MSLEIASLCKSFPKDDPAGTVEVLSDISLTIEAGSFVSIIGPSGCGKSTLLRLIAGLATPTSGSIDLDGVRISGVSEKTGFVFQSYALFPWLNVADNIAFPLAMKNASKQQRRARALDYVERFGLRGFEGSFPAELSGGMQQRVAIARSLIDNAEVLLMDEPFGALDSQTRSRMQQFLLEVWQQTRCTVLLITHNIDEAVFLGQRVVCLTQRPARVGDDILIESPYPRDVTSDEFNVYRRRVLKFLDREHAAGLRDKPPC